MNAPETLFANSAAETDKTGETDCVGNAEFLRTVFGDQLADTRPILVSFTGNPQKIAKSAWFGKPWGVSPDASPELPADANNYFSLAVFKPDEAGTYRRQKARFHALHAVMLDDVGTKVPVERLTLPPTWQLETSPGNHQVGYLLNEPIIDGPTADRLMNAIVQAGLCDPGANGPRARLARLPVAINGKHAPPYTCRIRIWSPDLRYSVDELVDGLQLEMAPAGRAKPEQGRPKQERPADGDAVFIPRPDENVVLAALRGRKLYKEGLGGGKHDITCPWVNEHTDAIDSGTVYFEPDDNFLVGGFRCQHGHCAKRRIRELLGFLEIDTRSARMRPTIRVAAGEIHRVVDYAEIELAQSGRHYQRGGMIVTVVTDPGTRETRVQDVTAPALVRGLARVALWEVFDRRSGTWLRADPPARHATVLFDSASYPHLPVLNGLTRQPYLRPDGSLMTAAGYDRATGMFGIFNASEYTIPQRPTRVQAEAALATLMDLLTEFSFAAASDQAAALAAIVTAAVRPSLPHAPMFHARAHTIGSGKSYLDELITAFATPQRGTPTTFPADDEECRKLLLAELLRAPAVIEFDNLTTDLLPHKSLCMALTSEYISGRILGVSKTATVNTRTLFLSSGNNVGPIADMARRCVTIHLNPMLEVPAARRFKRPDLVKDVLNERGRYVSAALTIVLAWIAAGRPRADCRPLATYGDWSDLCRQPLLWLGCADPTASIFEAMAEDPDRETLDRMLKAWHSAFGKTPTMVRDAVSYAHAPVGDSAELKEVLHDIADERGDINRRKLGWWIKRQSGRIVDGRRFMRSSGSRSAEAWQVESVSTVSPVSGGPNEESVSTKKSPFKDYYSASRGE